jgi:hypothetical protein
MRKMTTKLSDVKISAADSVFRLDVQIRSNGLNTQAYPTGDGVPPLHLGNSAMGFGNITHAEGFLDSLKDSYEYMPSPVCSASQPDCGSKYLWCDVAEAHCIPINPAFPPNPPTTPGPPTGPGSTPRPPIGPHPPGPLTCPSPKPQAYQNSFCVNGRCDVSQWVWVPVKIVTQRPPEFTDYQSFPVQNGRIFTGTDIYSPAAYADVRQYVNILNKI